MAFRRPGTTIGGHQPVLVHKRQTSFVDLQLRSRAAGVPYKNGYDDISISPLRVLGPHRTGIKRFLQTQYPSQRVPLCGTVLSRRTRIRCAPALINQTGH